MQWARDIFESVRDFMELGGPVLTVIGWTIFLMWAVIVERMIFYQTDLRKMSQSTRKLVVHTATATGNMLRA